MTEIKSLCSNRTLDFDLSSRNKPRVVATIRDDRQSVGIAVDRAEFFDAVRNLGAAVFDDADLPKVERGEDADGPYVEARHGGVRHRVWGALNVEEFRARVLVDLAILRELEREPLPDETEARRLAQVIADEGNIDLNGSRQSVMPFARRLVAKGVRVSET